MSGAEWDEKNKRWNDSFTGAPLSKADMTQRALETAYNYDLRNVGRYLPGSMSPDVRGQAISNIQRELQQGYYKGIALPGDYIDRQTKLDIGGMQLEASKYGADRGVQQAMVTGQSAAQIGATQEAAEADALQRMLMYGGGGAGGGDITKAGRASAPSIPPIQEADTSTLEEASKPPAHRLALPPDSVSRKIIGPEDYRESELPISRFLRETKKKRRAFEQRDRERF